MAIVIAIAIDGGHRGAVFFWDHEDERQPPSWDNVHRVADSFSEFLTMLTDDA